MNRLSKRIILFAFALFISIISMTDMIPACGDSVGEEYELFCETYTDERYAYTLYGYKDRSGNIVIPCEYTHLYGFIDGGCVAAKYVTSESGWRYEKVYLIDKENTVLSVLDTYAYYLDNEDWYETAQCFVVYDESTDANRVINRQGKEALADTYSYISANQYGPYINIELNEGDEVCIDRYMQAALCGKHFEVIYPCREDDEGKLFFPVLENGLIGVVDESGEYTTPPVYTKLDDSLAYPCYEAYYSDGRFTYAAYDGHAMELPEEWIHTYW